MLFLVILLEIVLINSRFVLSEEECKVQCRSEEECEILCKVPKCCSCELEACLNPIDNNGFNKNCDVIRTINIFSKEQLMNSFDIKNDIFVYNNHTFKKGEYCLSDTSEQENYTLRLCYSKDYCTKSQDNNLLCLKKCCPHGKIFRRNQSGKVECANGENANVRTFIDRLIHDDFSDIILFHNRMDCVSYLASPMKYKYYFTKNGSFFIEELGRNTEYSIDQQKYCLETFQNKTEVIVCSITNENTKFHFSRPILVLSCVSLLLALFRFMFCFKSMKLMQRMLVCFCGSEFVSFSIIAILQFKFLTPKDEECKFIGFLHLFSILATFLWSNVISFSLWKSLRSMSSKPRTQDSCNKTFLIYSAYVWIVAAIITLLCFTDHIYYILPDKFHPFLGRTRCMLEHSFKETNFGYIIYFIIPTSAIILINMIFFVYTIGYFVNVKMGITKTGNFQNGIPTKFGNVFKDTFKMSLKLFVLMSCTWFFEIISTLFDFKKSYVLERVEIVFDSINSLQGFFLLIIFHHNMFTPLLRICRVRRKENISLTTMASV